MRPAQRLRIPWYVHDDEDALGDGDALGDEDALAEETFGDEESFAEGVVGDPDGETLARNPKAMPPPAASCDGSAEKKLPPRCTVIVDDDGIRRCTCGKRLSNPDRPFDKGHEPCLFSSHA